MMLHGENSMHGWGQNAIPSNQLLFVRGFDPATQRYRYEVNQRFGATAVGADDLAHAGDADDDAALRRRPDARASGADADARSRPHARRHRRLPEQTLKAFGPIGITNPMAAILRQADTLELTPQQADSIAVLNRGFTIKLDSVWSPVAKYLAALPNATTRTRRTTAIAERARSSVDALIKIVPTVKSLLTAEQMRRLPTYHHALPRSTLPRVGSLRQRRHGPRHDHGRRDGAAWRCHDVGGGGGGAADDHSNVRHALIC